MPFLSNAKDIVIQGSMLQDVRGDINNYYESQPSGPGAGGSAKLLEKVMGRLIFF
jgi:hypothetical protein